MGCDIHSYAEVKTATGWTWARDLDPNPEYEFERHEVPS